jgi:lysophospholipase L1-like esterase
MTNQEYNSRFDARLAANKSVVPNNLYGKNIIAIGDSMVQGHSLSDAQTWLALIANRNDMTHTNEGPNGAYMANVQYGGVDNSVYQKLCVSGSAMYISDAELEAADYIVIYAGTNDCQNNVTLGDTSSTDPDEYSGAINLICQALQTRATQARLCFFTPMLRNGIEDRCATYINRLKELAAKYSIPVFDNGAESGICWSSSAIRTRYTLDDTYHLNPAGMEYVSYKYEAFLRTI